MSFLILQAAVEPPVAEHALSFGSILLRIGIAFVLVAANGFFVASEFALVGARRTRIEALARAGSKRAKLAESAIHRLDHYISGTQLGITLASLALGWVGESTIAAIIVQLFDGMPPPFDAVASHVVATIIAFTFITFLHIVLGELAPKSMALLFPESVAMWTAGPLIIFARALTPFIVFLNGTANLLLSAFNLRAPHEMERVHRPEEIQMLLTQTFEHGLLRQDPVEMIRGVFGLSETTAAEVMTPRTAVIGIEADQTVAQAAAFILDEGHSRYPVYEESIDRIIGVVLARDVWKAQTVGTTALRDIVRPPLFVPDTKPIEQLLREMRREGAHMGIVIDEFGGTAGVVTIEDVVEEIVGEIVDELDEAAPEIDHGADGELLLSGGFAISELNELYDLRLPDEDYTTIGGFLLGRLGRVARVGDEVTIRGGVLRVLEMDGRRVARVALFLRQPSSEDVGMEADEDWE
ncbi:MAG: hemolysin family protein [Gemmatimonadota bacterium]